MTWKQSHRLTYALSAVAIMTLAGCYQNTLIEDAGIQDEGAAELMSIGSAAHQAGDPIAAIGYYQRANQESPDNPNILLALAEAFGDAGDYEGAINAYDQAADAGASEEDVLRGTANALTSLDRAELALPKLQRAVMIDPSAGNYNSLGVTLDALGDAGQAQEAYRQGLSVDPDNRGLANNLGLSLALSGDYHESIEILETLVMLPGSHSLHRQNLALAHGLAGDYERAGNIGREDLDELAVVRNLSYYRVLRAMNDHSRKVQVVGIMRRDANVPGIIPAGSSAE